MKLSALANDFLEARRGPGGRRADRRPPRHFGGLHKACQATDCVAIGRGASRSFALRRSGTNGSPTSWASRKKVELSMSYNQGPAVTVQATFEDCVEAEIAC